MKKTQAFEMLLLVVILASASTQGQFVKVVGLKAGVAISDFRVSADRPANRAGVPVYPQFVEDNVVSPSVCLFARFLNDDHFALQSDLTYWRKGASRTISAPRTTAQYPEGDGTTEEYRFEIGLQCLEFALLAQPRYSFGDMAIYASVGPTVNYLLSLADFQWPLGQVRRFQGGYTVAVGAELAHFLASQFLVDLRYDADLSSFGEQNHTKLWNRSWLFSIGMTF